MNSELNNNLIEDNYNRDTLTVEQDIKNYMTT